MKLSPFSPARGLAIGLSLGLVFAGSAVHAQVADAADINQVRATTAKLIKLLVDQGLLTRDKAEALLKEVEVPATATATATANAPVAGAAAGKAAAPATVRVPFVPEFVRKEIKDEVRAELAAQAAKEGWAAPGSVPDWVRGLRWDGDLRVRYQHDSFADDNAPAVSVNDTNRNRALALLNTSEDRHRLRVRARLGLTATIDPNWSAAVRLTTGSATDPVSSNQTLGNYGNRFTVALDRAFVRWRSGDDYNVVAGRFGNPWFGSDLVWANDLSFDGVAAQWTPRLLGGRYKGFLTLAALPVQEVELASADKWLFGAQIGAERPGSLDAFGAKLGLGYYKYTNMVGQLNAPGSSKFDYTAPSFAQKGNTYFNISSDVNRPLLALAAEYQLLNLTGSLDFPGAMGKRILLSGDFVKNLGFDQDAVSARLGTRVEPKTRAYMVRAAFGDPEITRLGAWQVFASYKHVERDAVLDAFTDSDFRLGGTDTKGLTLGGSYGVGRNSSVLVRYLSGDSLSGAPLSVDVLQVDLNVRF